MDDDATIAEEKHFLKDYSIPMVQLESKKTILVFAHAFNSYDKHQLLVDANPKYVKETRFRPSVRSG